jgi:hypothetical protein
MREHKNIFDVLFTPSFGTNPLRFVRTRIQTPKKAGKSHGHARSPNPYRLSPPKKTPMAQADLVVVG